MTLTLVAMLAFAGNSLLCRAALKHTGIDAASFITIRLVSGAVMLWLVVRIKNNKAAGTGNWVSAGALFAYAVGFSFAYSSLSAATGALLLFGAVQITMIGYGIWKGERLVKMQIIGLVLALLGLVVLLLPGLAAPPLYGTVMMVSAGIAWGIYSLRGKGAGDPTSVTAGNFLRGAPIALVLSLVMFSTISIDLPGFLYAVASGALTSGVGYAIWYAALPGLKATSAATVQLSVPVIAALGGVVFLGESVTLRLVLAAAAILGGILLVILEKRQPDSHSDTNNYRR